VLHLSALIFIPAFSKNILLPPPGINALLSGFAWCTTKGHRKRLHTLQKEKGEILMKTSLIRILTIATLATSISAFAATDESKQNNAAASANDQQAGCAAYTQKDKKQKNAKPRRDDQRTEQEKEFDHTLMGYFG
jgi:hypothetical protein